MGREPLKPFTSAELNAALVGPDGDPIPPVLSPQQFADLLGLSTKTIYEWIAKGRLKGAARKRGKHVLIWRDRALNKIFHGKDWTK